METVFGHDLHPAVQEILHIRQKGAEREARFVRGQRNQQIDIARIAGVAPRHGPEHPDVADAVACGEREDLGAVGFDQRMHRNLFMFRAQARMGRRRRVPAGAAPWRLSAARIGKNAGIAGARPLRPAAGIIPERQPSCATIDEGPGPRF